MDPTALFLIAASYPLGGIPSGRIIARRVKGIDILEHGSGNPGAANVFRVVGPGAGLATLAADALKGFIPALAALLLSPDAEWLALTCGALAILGHFWMPFLGLMGGKGVATTAGVFLALTPLPMIPTLFVFIAAVAVTGHISVGSIAGAAVFPFLALSAGSGTGRLLLAFGACALILIKHIPNIRRLLEARELRIRR